jgi:hypothetical protein
MPWLFFNEEFGIQTHKNVYINFIGTLYGKIKPEKSSKKSPIEQIIIISQQSNHNTMRSKKTK